MVLVSIKNRMIFRIIEIWTASDCNADMIKGDGMIFSTKEIHDTNWQNKQTMHECTNKYIPSIASYIYQAR
jgi:hypothetical protein